MIRDDGPATVGTSTQTLAEQALERGQLEEAAELIEYFRSEIVGMLRLLELWQADLVAHLGEAEGLESGAWLGEAVLDGPRAFDAGAGDARRAVEAARAGDAAAASAATEAMRVRYLAIHDLYVAWIQRLLARLAERDGEEAVLGSIRRTYERLWAPRYAAWERMSLLERLQLTVEGMRAHLSGEGRRGDAIVTEDDERYTIAFDPCGSGGVLRRGDPESGRPPVDPEGVNREPHDWTWGKTGVHWYCAHCCIAMEHLPAERTGYVLRPLDHDLDHDAPCVWHIYKDPKAARREHYRRIGRDAPPEAG